MVMKFVITPPYAVIALLTFPLHPVTRYRVISGWARIVLFLARVICGLRYEVIGRENIPSRPCIILCKHQSAWETIALQEIFPPQVWVLKRELLRIPFFGWGLAMTSPIAIDRSAGSEAMQQMVEQGRDRLALGFCIVIFPEGTRIAPGKKGRYKIGGAWLATHLEQPVPVVPVAHNAGVLWGRNSFLKYPGTIRLSIGKPIAPAGMDAGVLNAQVEAWIEAEVARLDAVSAEKN